MNQFAYDEIEWVGFDGVLLVECGCARPLVRHYELQTKQHYFFKVSPQVGDKAIGRLLGTKSEIDKLYEEGRVTLLDSPIKITFPGDMVVYATSELFEAVGLTLQTSSQTKNEQIFPVWEQLPDQKGWAAWGTETVIETLLNDWGRQLMKKATDSLREYFAFGQVDDGLRSEAERLTEIARAAAINPGIRERIHLRHALSVRLSGLVEDIEILYDLTHHDFPQWDQAEFEEQLDKFELSLRKEAAKPSTMATPIAENEQLWSEDTTTIRFHKLQQAISQVPNLCERIQRSQLAAKNFPVLLSQNTDLKSALKNMRVNSSWIQLDQEIIPLIAGDPIYYDQGVCHIASDNKRLFVSPIQLRISANNYEQAGIAYGPITKILLEKINDAERAPLVMRAGG